MDDALFDGLDFGDDVSLAGFRCQRLEVFNWGTFDQTIWGIDLDGRNGLLTGDIGSGKSTLVDAMTTLLVPPAKLNYNKAAGADTKERSLATYVLGNYKAEKSSTGNSTRAVTLRDHSTISVIVGVFHNDGYDETLTLAQVFYFKKAEGQPERFYVLSPTPLNIKQDFLGEAKNIAALRKTLRDKGATIEDSFEKYRAGFSRVFGIKNPQALDLFHQTVSMKQVGNLTDFVRSHMLEPFDVAARRDRLLAHFDDLTRAHAAIQKAKRQIEMLTPLVEKHATYSELMDQSARDRACREGLGVYFDTEKLALLGKRIAKLGDTAAQLEKRVQAASQKAEELRDEEAQLRVDIAQNGGDQMQQVAAQIAVLDKTVEQRQHGHEEFARHAAVADVPVPHSAEALEAALQRVGELMTHVDEQLSVCENRKTEITVEFYAAQKACTELKQEIESLKARQTNLPAKVVELRERIAEGVGLQTAELPFAGELLEVDATQRDWEGAAERVLHNFSLSMLVPEASYQRVAGWVEANHLRGRLVYYRVPRDVTSRMPELDANSLVHKLNIKPGTPHADWLDAELAHRFNYTCAADLKEFSRSTKAITRTGHMKSGGARHEKDDRTRIDDRRHYTLGWSNAAKIKAMQAQFDRAADEASELAAQIEEQKKLAAAWRGRRDACVALRHYTDFDAIDWESAVQERQRLKEHLAELERANDILAVLREKLKQVQVRIRERQDEADAARDKLGGIRERISGDEKQQARLETELAGAELAQDVRDGINDWRTRTEETKDLTIETCDSTQSRVRVAIQTELDKVTRRTTALAEAIVAAMQRFNSDYPLESREFDASLDAADEYHRLHAQLTGDDLPRFEATFKEMLNKNAIREIAAFNTALHGEATEITTRIGHINEALDKIDYNPSRRIILERHAGEDHEVTEFKADLRACLQEAAGGAESDAYSEQRFLQVKKILDRFAGRDGTAEVDKRWTEKVTDVRNWFSFSASERWRDDDTEHEHYTDSGGKSGGQKEKLAYTILAASLAYKFGLDWGEARSRSLRFVVIDEAFGRGSDESAQYGLRLFNELNLQLLIVTPLQKIHVIEPHVSSVSYVTNPTGDTSLLRTMSIEEYRAERAQHEAVRDSDEAEDDAADGTSTGDGDVD